MVVSMGGKPQDNELRLQMENHLISDLAEKGYNALSAYKMYGPKAFEHANENEVLNALQRNQIDAVITVVLLNKTKEKYYVPGRVSYPPYVIYYRRFWGYYTTMFDRIYEPGYYSEETNYFLEYNLFDLETKALLYSAQTKSFNPASIRQMAHENDQLIVGDLIKKRILN